MNGRLNLNSVQSYSKKFANAACNNYFINKEAITGNDILSFSSVSQINLMVIKLLLNKWKEQSESIRSPYFNFENDQVKLVYNNLMNLLSQNILVKRDTFEELVAEATSQSLVLTIEPFNYFKSKVESLEKKVITKNDLKEVTKYLQINNNIAEKTIEKISNQFISTEDFLELLDSTIQTNTDELYNPSLLISQLSSVSNVAISELVDLNSNPETKILQAIIEEKPITNIFAEIEEKVSKITVEEITHELKENHIAEHLKVESVQKEIEVSAVIADNKIIVEEKQTIVLVNDETITTSLNDKFTGENEIQTLNDRLKKEGDHRASVLDELSKKTKINSVKEAIPMFKRFEFINSLFNGENMEYHQAISLVDQSDSYENALNGLKNTYANKYNWNYDDKKVLELLDLVERRHLSN